jgi:hypothetical protein
MEQLYGEEHAMTVESKARVEIYHRKFTVDKVNAAREAIAMKQLESENKGKGVIKIVNDDSTKKLLIEGEEGEGKSDKKKSNNKKNKKTKK